MCVNEINSLYDIARMLLGCELPPQFEFLYAILTLVIAIAFVASIFAPFWLVYKFFD